MLECLECLGMSASPMMGVELLPRNRSPARKTDAPLTFLPIGTEIELFQMKNDASDLHV